MPYDVRLLRQRQGRERLQFGLIRKQICDLIVQENPLIRPQDRPHVPFYADPFDSRRQELRRSEIEDCMG
jgi:hypothetical protein